MTWKPGEKLSVARLNRLSSSIPTSYTVFKDGSTYRAECNFSGGTNYSGTDAATVIQAAIDASASGSRISLKPAIYPISHIIYVNVDGLTIEGESPNTYDWRATPIEGGVFLRASESLNGGIIVANPSESMDGGIAITVKNLVLDGDNHATTDGLVLHVPLYSSLSHVESMRCRDGLVLYGGGRNYFENIVSMHNTGYALRIERSPITDHSAFEFTFVKAFFLNSYIGCYVNFTTKDGGVGKFTFIDCQFEMNRRQGAYFRNMEFLSMYTCHFEENNQDLADDVASLDFAALPTYSSGYMYLHDLRFIETKTVWGILLNSFSYGVIENCFINCSDTSLRIDESHYLTISNNIFMKSLIINDSTNIILVGNTKKSGVWTFSNNIWVSYILNPGFVTAYSDVATIPNGGSSVTVPHALSGIPTIVTLGAKHAEVADAIWSADDTNITITVPANVTDNRKISWHAEYEPCPW